MQLSNNLSENAIRPFVVGREGWLFSDTQAGAETSAVIYTMVENAKANGVNVYQYLKLLLEKQPNNRMSDEELERLYTVESRGESPSGFRGYDERKWLNSMWNIKGASSTMCSRGTFDLKQNYYLHHKNYRPKFSGTLTIQSIFLLIPRRKVTSPFGFSNF